MRRKILLNWVLPFLGAFSLWATFYHYRRSEWLFMAVMGTCTAVFWRLWWVRKKPELDAKHQERLAARRARAAGEPPDDNG